jgi:hypothetical protein
MVTCLGVVSVCDPSMDALRRRGKDRSMAICRFDRDDSYAIVMPHPWVEEHLMRIGRFWALDARLGEWNSVRGLM